MKISENKLNPKYTIIIASLVVLLLAVISYFVITKKTGQKNNPAPLSNTKSDSSISTTKPNVIEDDYDEEGEYQSESYVIANEAYLRSAPNKDEYSMVRKLKFGDKFYIKNSEQTNGYYMVYASKPLNEKNPTEELFYISESALVYASQFEDYKKYFSLTPFSALASKTKKLILDQNYNNGTSYYLTQNLERAKTCICYGDFDNDGVGDLAVVLDNNEKQATRLLVICTNKITQDPYLAFAENYSDKIKINSFKKGAKVFMGQVQDQALTTSAEALDENGFSKSPNDGIIVKGEDLKIAIIYNQALQKYKTYFQE